MRLPSQHALSCLALVLRKAPFGVKVKGLVGTRIWIRPGPDDVLVKLGLGLWGSTCNGVTEEAGKWRLEGKLLVLRLAMTNYTTSPWSGKKLPLPRSADW